MLLWCGVDLWLVSSFSFWGTGLKILLDLWPFSSISLGKKSLQTLSILGLDLLFSSSASSLETGPQILPS